METLNEHHNRTMTWIILQKKLASSTGLAHVVLQLASKNLLTSIAPVKGQIFEKINSSDRGDKLNAVSAIVQLIELNRVEGISIELDELSEFLQYAFPPHCSDISVISEAAIAVGLIAADQSSASSSYGRVEANRALNLLTTKSDSRRYTAACILGRLALNVPALFYDQVVCSSDPNVLEALLATMQDSKPALRDVSTFTFRMCVLIGAQREHQLFDIRGNSIAENILQSLKKSKEDTVYASLLGLKDLIEHTSMKAKPKFIGDFRRAVGEILEHRGSTSIQQVAIEILPHLCVSAQAGSVDLSAESERLACCEMAMRHLSASFAVKRDRPFALIALGKMAQLLDEATLYRFFDITTLDKIFSLMRLVLTANARKAKAASEPGMEETLRLVVMMAESKLCKRVQHFAETLVDPILELHLTSPLVASLQAIASLAPAQSKKISLELLRILHLILSSNREAKLSPDQTLAIETFGRFSFDREVLCTGQPLFFAHTYLTPCFSDVNPSVRELAALACASFLLSLKATLLLAKNEGRKVDQEKEQENKIHYLIAILLQLVKSDTSPLLRVILLDALNKPEFDDSFCRIYKLPLVLSLLDDELYPIRESALEIVGRMQASHSSEVLPMLRTMINDLVISLQRMAVEDPSKFSISLPDDLKLLSHYITSIPELAVHHCDAIMNVVLPLLKGPIIVRSLALSAVGDLAKVGRTELSKYVPRMLPVIVSSIQNHSSRTLRQSAISCFTNLVCGTLSVIDPYFLIPNLMQLLMQEFSFEQDEAMRRDLIRLIGALGLPDPVIWKSFQNTSPMIGLGKDGLALPSLRQSALNTSLLEMRHMDVRGDGLRATGAQGTRVLSKFEMHEHKGSDQYYVVAAINSLMRIANDPTQTTHHDMVVRTVIIIFEFLGGKCSQYLPQIIPSVIFMIRNSRSDSSSGAQAMTYSMLSHLAHLIALARASISSQMNELLSFIAEFWDQDQVPQKMIDALINLFESMIRALDSEISVFLPRILPKLVECIERRKDVSETALMQVVNLFSILDDTLEGYLHVCVPPLVTLMVVTAPTYATTLGPSLNSVQLNSSSVFVPTVSLRLAILDSLRTLASSLNFSEVSSVCVHGVAKLLEISVDCRVKALDFLTYIMIQMGPLFARSGYLIMIGELVAKYHIQCKSYNHYVRCLLFNDRPPPRKDITPYRESRSSIDQTVTLGSSVVLHVNRDVLEAAWNMSVENWAEWLKYFNRVLLKESSSPALRACADLAENHPSLARELFYPAFVSCWSELYEDMQDELAGVLEQSFDLDHPSHDVQQILLNLAEFMETMNRGRLPLKDNDLAKYACLARAYAKALHYEEIEFRKLLSPEVIHRDLNDLNSLLIAPYDFFRDGRQKRTAQPQLSDLNSTSIAGQKSSQQLVPSLGYLKDQVGKPASPSTSSLPSNSSELTSGTSRGPHSAASSLENSMVKIIEDLIQLNNSLQLPQTAAGILEFANSQLNLSAELNKVRPSWDESLGNYEKALHGYENLGVGDETVLLGRMRCLDALGRWSELHNLVQDSWETVSVKQRSSFAPIACSAALGVCQPSSIRQYVSDFKDEDDIQGLFYRAVLAVHENNFSDAKKWLNRCRSCMDNLMTSLTGESYERTYNQLINAQLFTELEEVMEFKLLKGDGRSRGKAHFRELWRKRLHGTGRNLRIWQQFIKLHSLVLPPQEDLDVMLEYTKICIENNLDSNAHSILVDLLGSDLLVSSGRLSGDSEALGSDLPLAHPDVTFAFIRYLWHAEERDRAMTLMDQFAFSLRPLAIETLNTSSTTIDTQTDSLHLPPFVHAHNGVPKGRKKPSLMVTDELAQARSLLLSPSNGFGAYKKPSVPLLDGDDSKTLDSKSLPSHLPHPVASAFHLLPSRNIAARAYHQLGCWKSDLYYQCYTEELISGILGDFQEAVELDKDWYNAWHSLALMNFKAIAFYERQVGLDVGVPRNSFSLRSTRLSEADETLSINSDTFSERMFAPKGKSPRISRTNSTALFRTASTLSTSRKAANNLNPTLAQHVKSAIDTEGKIRACVVAALRAFTRAIHLNPGNKLQDTLRFLRLWFNYGEDPIVNAEVADHRASIDVDFWLGVIPQFIARIDINEPLLRQSIHQILIDVGKSHPQALIMPLTVASTSKSPNRALYAGKLLLKIKELHPQLVEQAKIVCDELVRVSILWQEIWFETLQDASRLFYDQRDVNGMVKTLETAHKMILEPSTLREISFLHSFGNELRSAEMWLNEYKSSKAISSISNAWTFYYKVYKRIYRMLSKMNTLDLQDVSPRLLQSQHLVLAVPGSYRANRNDVISISSFSPHVTVMSSKQRPRKLSLVGSNGVTYMYLLKHEDPRMDERAMDVFGLVNTLLASHSKSTLNITTFSINPLASDCGLIGWVPNCDTLNILIKEARHMLKVNLNTEHAILRKLSPDTRDSNGRPNDKGYDALSIIQKIEAFRSAISVTRGDDLAHIFRAKSPDSETWLSRRTHFTQSLAVMSMVGYILGLGDRHPSNIMIDRISGGVVHIDFGDCFEVAQQREKYPEKVPFRLTRLLVEAMEVSGIEGTYRRTCEEVMAVLRNNKDSLIAVLEAFVHDPLLSWRQNVQAAKHGGEEKEEEGTGHEDEPESALKTAAGTARLSVDPAHLVSAIESNQRALKILTRVEAKLNGRDFQNDFRPQELDVKAQVDLLIRSATSHTNLCQSFLGWCSFW